MVDNTNDSESSKSSKSSNIDSLYNNKIDNNRTFNLEFDKIKQLTKTEIDKNTAKRLAEMNIKSKPKNITDMSVYEILIGIKDTIFGIGDDIMRGDISIKIITKNNRLFFIGLTMIVFAMLLYLYEIIMDDDIEVNKKIVEVRHVYVGGDGTNNNNNNNNNKINTDIDSLADIFN